MRAHRPLVAALSVLCLSALAACSSAEPTASAPAPEDGRITVVASTNVYGSIAQAVGGDLVTVESLITDPAADPHSYESTPADADVVILNGGGYDEFMPGLIESAGGAPTVLDVSVLSGLVPPGETDFNEHFWYSLPTVQTLASDLAQTLAAADAANAEAYNLNAGTFNAEVDGLIQQLQEAGASVPAGRVAVTEPVPGYLIDTAGLTDVTPEEFAEAVEEDTDPPAVVVADTLALFSPSSDPVRALIVNAQTQTPTTDQVVAAAEGAGVPVVEMSETLPEGQDIYTVWMRAQIEALIATLNPV